MGIGKIYGSAAVREGEVVIGQSRADPNNKLPYNSTLGQGRRVTADFHLKMPPIPATAKYQRDMKAKLNSW